MYVFVLLDEIEMGENCFQCFVFLLTSPLIIISAIFCQLVLLFNFFLLLGVSKQTSPYCMFAWMFAYCHRETLLHLKSKFDAKDGSFSW